MTKSSPLIIGLFWPLFLIATYVHGQTEPAFTADEQAELDALDEFLTQTDSISIINLLDSLIQLEKSLNQSQVVIKSGYNAESLTNNRESLGTENGFYSGIGYYHKSGLFADAQIFWNSQFDPNHYLTTGSVGFMGFLGKHWSYIASYDHYFFNKQAETEFIEFPYTDGFNLSGYFNYEYVETGVDYSIIFGNSTFTSHQLNYSIAGKMSFRNVLIFNKITLKPTFGLLWGNQSIFQVIVNRQFINPTQRFTVVEENKFGLLNIGLLVPAYLSIHSFNLGLGYQLNLPQELPGEDLSYNQSHVFNISISYFIKR